MPTQRGAMGPGSCVESQDLAATCDVREESILGAWDIDGGQGEGGRRANHRSPRGRRTCQQSDGNRAQKEQSYESSMGLSPKRCHEISSSLNGSRWVLEVTKVFGRGGMSNTRP